MSEAKKFSPTSAMLELSMMNAEATTENIDDLIVDALSRGVPPEVATRLSEIWKITKNIGNEVIAVGKIVVLEIFRFIKENPNLSIGTAIGAAIAFLVASIPLVGPLLAPYAAVLAPLYGAGTGAAMDSGRGSMEAAILLASKFFELLKNIFTAVSERWAS
jgi:hypothetical protein